MLYHPPTLPFQGLIIIASQGSRFDTTQLFSGNAGNWFNAECIRPGMNRWQCHLYDVEAFDRFNRQYPDGTKCVLLLGERAHREVGGQQTTLGEHRGSPFIRNGIVHISSYLPQDTHDIKDYESSLNPLLADNDEEQEEGEDEDRDTNAASEKSRHGKTARANYRFWLQRDTRKAVRIAKENGILRLPKNPNFL